MANLKDKIFGIILVIICGFFCNKCASDYMKGGDAKAIANYKQMLADKSFIEAQLSEEYTQTTVKIMKVPITTYAFTYYFFLNGQTYNGKHSFESKLPESDKIKVYYLKTDPRINCVDPASLLAIEEEKNASNGDLYWAIGWGLIGLIFLLGLFSKEEKKNEQTA